MNKSLVANLADITLDNTYWAVSLETWELILAYNGASKNDYVKDSFDCDNFALCLAGNVPQRWGVNGVAIVIDFSGQHAYNALLVVDENGVLEVAVVEPQNDEFVIRKQGMYKGNCGFALLA